MAGLVSRKAYGGSVLIEEESSEIEKLNHATGYPSIFTLEQVFIDPHQAIFIIANK